MVRVASLLLLLLAGPSVRGKLEDEVTHVGCFPLTAGNYKAEDDLSWKQCLYMCDQRLMTYAGVQADQNAPTFTICYCMDTLDQSTEVESSLCGVCEDDSQEFCGGDSLVSVYKLPERDSGTFLLASNGLLEEVRRVATSITRSNIIVNSVDFHFETNTIFFTTDNYIYKSSYSPLSMKYTEPKVFLRNGNRDNSQVKRVIVDWINNKCYFLYYICCYESGFYQTDLYGLNQAEVRLVHQQIESVSLDARRRLMFYISENTLYSYNLKSTKLTTYRNGTLNFKILLKVVANVPAQEIYILGADDNDQYYLISFNYDEKNRKVLFRGPQLSNPITFDVYNNYIIWINKEEDNFKIYECKLLSRCLKENLKQKWHANKEINDLKIYHSQVQIYEDSCTVMECSHNCTLTSQSPPKCSCPEGLVLLTDNKTCEDPCKELECSHNCSLTPQLRAECTCPETLVLDADNTTCIEPCEQLNCSHTCTSNSQLIAECSCPAPLVLRTDNRTCFDPCKELECSHNCSLTPQLRAECTCPELLILDADNTTCIERARSLDNMTYLGCYQESKADKVLHSLSWEESIHFCDHRRTVYAAVQAEPSVPDFNFPFCMNNLPQNVRAVNSSLCHQCEETHGRFCGGDGVMSLYRLREVSPLTVLLATENGIRIYSDDTHAVTDLFYASCNVTSVDYFLPEDKIFYTWKSGMWRTYYSPSSQRYVQSAFVSFVGDSSVMAVDWINKKLIFSQDNYIYESELGGDFPVRIKELYHQPLDLAVDPINRLIFYLQDLIDRITLYSFEIENSKTNEFKNENFHIEKVMKISVDAHGKTIYMIGQENDHFRLIHTDYVGERGRELYKGAELAAPDALAVWGRQAVWVSNQGGVYTMYACTLTPRCRSSGLRMLSRSTQVIYAIRIYSVDLQTQTKNPMLVCGDLGCFHGNSSRTTLRPVPVDQNTSVGSYETTTPTDFVNNGWTVNTALTQTDSPQTERQQVLETLIEKWTYGVENVDQEVTKTVELQNTTVSSDRNKGSNGQQNHLSWFNVLVIVLGLVILVLLVSGVFVVVKLQKPNGQLEQTNKPVSEMELTNSMLPIE